MRETLEILNDINKLVVELEVKYKQAQDKSTQLDRMLSQIYHEIEFESMDAVAMMKKYKELKGVLKLRRSYKNRVERMKVTRGHFSSGSINEAINNYSKSKSGQSKKQFKDRISEELRKELLKEIDNMNNEGE